jgi:hypothetical protein
MTPAALLLLCQTACANSLADDLRTCSRANFPCREEQNAGIFPSEAEYRKCVRDIRAECMTSAKTTVDNCVSACVVAVPVPGPEPLPTVSQSPYDGS